MARTPHIPSELLALYLSGEADGAQRRAVEAWAAEAPANADELRRMRAVWDLGGQAADLPEVDVDRAWAKLEGRIADAEGKGRVRTIGARTWTRWLSAAAMVAMLVLATRWFFQPSSTTYLAQAQPKQIVLADSSRTVLFPGSTLKESLGKQRAMQLEGRAYFVVRRDEQRPFTVDAGDLRVTVLGTAFEVADYDTAAFATVRVRTGHVRVVAGTDTVELLAGDHLRYDKQRHLLERRPAPPMEVYGLRVLKFEGAPMARVVEQLENLYQVRITMGNERIADCRLTAEFNDEPIAGILDVIAQTFGLQLTKDAGTYKLDGDGC
ncbi:MAG: FecR domain-containing protein [Flavobacteriales bacterium]|nr:FecR domain-containing protein [Flavobacteriales bacterium]